MCGKEEKRLFTAHEHAIDKFWSSLFYPTIANNHTFTNVNKQVAVHFFYQTMLNCTENQNYILSQSEMSNGGGETSSTSVCTKMQFTNCIAKELPMCTVAVDHEDGELISYNRQCLHPYYATIRLLCQASPAYAKEMTSHSNFQWAFKHIMPFANYYPTAVQELNKCIQVFIGQEAGTKRGGKGKKRVGDESIDVDDNKKPDDDNDDDDEEEDEDEESAELHQMILAFKETLATNFLMNQEIDPKQSWQSIVMVMKSIIETIDDGTLVLTRRGLSVLSVCFLQISLLHHQSSSNSSDTGSVVFELCECMQILMQLCETVKHHVDKRTDGIRQIIQAWKEKSEVCKRALMLVNFFNTGEIRVRALDLVRMILAVSPNETTLQVLQILYNAYFSSHCQVFISYTTCSSKSKCQQCVSTSTQLTSQATHLMGPHFPLGKKSPNANVTRAPKPHFNMFLPVMFIAHSHTHGAIVVNSQIPEYEKTLVDNYVPFLTFFDYVCRTAFGRRLVGATNDQASVTKQIIDLILVVSQQSVLLNISFISYLNTLLTAEAGQEAEGSSSALAQQIQDCLNYVLDSSYLYSFINTIIADFRHLLNRKEIYEFMQLLLPRYVESLITGDNNNEAGTSSSKSSPRNSLLTGLKVFIEKCCQSANEIRFYFEFQQMSKHLIKSINDSSLTAPNITQHVEFKSTQMLGSIKAIYLLLNSVVENEELNLLKLRVEVKNFLIEIIDYLNKQIVEMNAFLLSIAKNEDKLSDIDKIETDHQIEEALPKKAKLDDNEACGSRSSCSKETLLVQGNAAVLLIVKQVELKRKYLEHVLQVLSTTLNHISAKTIDLQESGSSPQSSSTSSKSPQIENQ